MMDRDKQSEVRRVIASGMARPLFSIMLAQNNATGHACTLALEKLPILYWWYTTSDDEVLDKLHIYKYSKADAPTPEQLTAYLKLNGVHVEAITDKE